MSRRQQRVADLVRQHVAEILLRDVQDPRVRLASVTNVRMTPDLKTAHIQLSILGEDDQRREATQILNDAAGFVRHELAARLRSLKVIPKLIFELDRGAEHSQHISELLEQLDGHGDST